MIEIESTHVNRTARTAGLLYLVVVVTGIFSLGYVPSQVVVQNDASATVGNITASEPLFRLGILAGLICYTAFLMLPFVLYRLLSPLSNRAAVLMVAFAVTSVPISFVNLLNKIQILSILSNTSYVQAVTTEHLHAQVMLLLDAYGNGILVSKVFWGLWLFPFGYLMFKSGLFPRVLGVLLMVGCLGYLIDVFGSVLFPGYSKTTIARFVTRPASLGEIGTCLWLLFVGARESKSSIISVQNTV